VSRTSVSLILAWEKQVFIFLTFMVAGKSGSSERCPQEMENSEVSVRIRRIARSCFGAGQATILLTILERLSSVCLTGSVIAYQVTHQNSKIDYLTIY
jgi:hypothetical protein